MFRCRAKLRTELLYKNLKKIFGKLKNMAVQI